MVELPIGSKPVGGSDYIPGDDTLPITPQKPVASQKDTVSQAQVGAPQSKQAVAPSDPSLPKPKSSFTFWEFLSVIADAKLSFEQILQESETVDQATRNKQKTEMIGLTESIENEYAAIDAASSAVDEKTNAAIKAGQKLYNDAGKLVSDMNDATKTMQKGNTQDKEEFKKLNAAYDTFMKGLKDLGATLQPNGTYSIPDTPEALEKYDKLLADYTKAVNSFQTYYNKRVQDINQYNAVVDNYNNQAKEMNAEINAFIDQYGLSASLNKDPIPLAQQYTVDTKPYEYIPLPKQTEINFKKYVEISKPPTYDSPIAKDGAPTLPTLSYSAPDLNKQKDKIRQSIYDTDVAPLEQQLQDDLNYLSFLSLEASRPVVDTIPDPVTNRKFIGSKILPDSLITYEGDEAAGKMLNMMQKYGISQAAEQMLAAQEMQRIMAQQNADMQEKAKELADKLTLLSAEQLSRFSRDALVPSAKTIGPALANLPKESPAFSVLFAVSFLKKVQESVQQGWTDQIVQDFIDKTPELKDLNPEQRSQLGAAYKAGQLITAAKFLAANLGMPELFAQRFLSMTEPQNIPQMQTNAGAANQASQGVLTQRLKADFMQKGFSEDKADFMSQFSAKGINQGMWMAPSLSTVSSANVNLPVLIDSLTAALLSPGEKSYSLDQAAQIAQKAAKQVLSEGPFNSPASFRKALQNELKDLGVSSLSGQASKEAILIPKNQPNAASPLIDLEMQEFLSSLLKPQIGKITSADLIKEMLKLMETTPAVLKDQLKLLPPDMANDLVQNSLNNNAGEYAFLSKLSLPASLLILSLPNEPKTGKDIVI